MGGGGSPLGNWDLPFVTRGATPQEQQDTVKAAVVVGGGLAAASALGAFGTGAAAAEAAGAGAAGGAGVGAADAALAGGYTLGGGTDLAASYGAASAIPSTAAELAAPAATSSGWFGTAASTLGTAAVSGLASGLTANIHNQLAPSRQTPAQVNIQPGSSPKSSNGVLGPSIGSSAPMLQAGSNVSMLLIAAAIVGVIILKKK